MSSWSRRPETRTSAGLRTAAEAVPLRRERGLTLMETFAAAGPSVPAPLKPCPFCGEAWDRCECAGAEE